MNLTSATTFNGYYPSTSGTSSPSTSAKTTKKVGSDSLTMTLNVAKEHLKVLLQEKMPVFLWGPPGIGKSSIVKQICEEWGWKLVDLRLSLLNPVDLRGLPYMSADKKESVWLKPDFLPTEGKGVLFLDELNTAPMSVQIAAYQLLLDRRIGSYIFPEGWRIIAAGNRETDRAFVSKMPSPLANRLIHINVVADIDDWKDWASKRLTDPRVIAFLNWRPALLAPPIKEEEKAYPTPRSWEFVSRILPLYKDPDDAEQIISGTVGEGACKEFLSFVRIYQDLPDVQEILEGKNKIVPQKPDVIHALISALVVNLKDEYLDNFISYTLELSPEFAVLAIKEILTASNGKAWREKIRQSEVFIKEWNPKFGKYVA